MVMYLTMPVDKIHIDRGVLELQQKLHIPGDFFKNLLNEDDKTFLSKLHDLIESKCASLLLFHFNEPRLKTLVTRLQLSNESNGKAFFLRELKLLGEPDIKFITTLSHYNNYFLYEAKDGYTLHDLIQSMDEGSLRRFALAFSPFETAIQKYSNLKPNLLDDQLIQQIDPSNLIARAKANPRLHIWLGAFHVLGSLAEINGFHDYLLQEQAS
jgi:hypothetical protein